MNTWGQLHQWRAYIFELSQDYASSLESYRAAAGFFDKCISQGENTGDRIIKEEIISKICKPGYANVSEIIDSLDGGQG